MMKYPNRNILFFFFSLVLLASVLINGCSVTQQAEQVYNLVNCDFRIRSVENINLAGINIQNTSDLKNLGMADMGRIMAALTKPTFPLTFRINIDGRNPNPTPAGLNRLDYIVYIDDIQITAGVLENSVTIPPNNGIVTIPIDMNVDLKKILQGKSMDAIVNFGFNLSGNGTKPSRILLKLKPSILVGTKMLSYPGYINVKTEFTGL
jgi:LEA14-like dessication related protein